MADISLGAREDQARAWRFSHEADAVRMAPAVSLAIAKRDGANAVVVSQAIEQRLHQLEGKLIPEGVSANISRNYGETANEKANELLFHLALATISIVILIAFAIGVREALVTAFVIPTTILLTLFASNLMGYTINRVSLFAIIFSIGILVDDAIVEIENIEKRVARGARPYQASLDGADSIGLAVVATTAAIVEMFTVPKRSPPVPTMSSTMESISIARACRSSRCQKRRTPPRTPVRHGPRPCPPHHVSGLGTLPPSC